MVGAIDPKEGFMSVRKLFVVAVAAAMFALTLAPTGAGAAQTATYEITITNLTGGQPLTPPAAATHKKSLRLFKVGTAASSAVQQIAENGNLGPMLDALAASNKVTEFVAAGAPDPILPDSGSVTFELSTTGGAKYFSFVSMLVCTNDGFTGLSSVRLPKKVGDSGEWYTDAYDAGTEANTENLADIVPPCSGFATGTDMSNPGLATNGVIAHHGGILGTGTGELNLDPEVHDWTNPVAMVEITRTS
jgi:hypothetical protein